MEVRKQTEYFTALSPIQWYIRRKGIGWEEFYCVKTVTPAIASAVLVYNGLSTVPFSSPYHYYAAASHIGFTRWGGGGGGGGGSASTKSTKLVAAFNGLYMCLCVTYILVPRSMVNTDADEGLRVIVSPINHSTFRQDLLCFLLKKWKEWTTFYIALPL